MPEEERPEEKIVSIIGPDTPAVVMDSAICILRIQHVGATTQTLAPLSESIIPPRIPDDITISHVNLSAPGYERASLRPSGMGVTTCKKLRNFHYTTVGWSQVPPYNKSYSREDG